MSTVYFIVQQMMFFSIPLLIVALGGLFSEKSGVSNVALDGIMIIGAFAGTFFISATGGDDVRADSANCCTAFGCIGRYDLFIASGILGGYNESKSDYRRNRHKHDSSGSYRICCQNFTESGDSTGPV